MSFLKPGDTLHDDSNHRLLDHFPCLRWNPYVGSSFNISPPVLKCCIWPHIGHTTICTLPKHYPFIAQTSPRHCLDMERVWLILMWRKWFDSNHVPRRSDPTNWANLSKGWERPFAFVSTLYRYNLRYLRYHTHTQSHQVTHTPQSHTVTHPHIHSHSVWILTINGHRKFFTMKVCSQEEKNILTPCYYT